MSIRRRIAYRIALDDRLERVARRRPAWEGRLYQRARRYVGGRDLEEALETVAVLTGKGFLFSLDFFGEGLETPDDIEAVVDEYRGMAAACPGGDVDLEVVPSHLGIDHSVELFTEHCSRIGALLPVGARLQISAEECYRTDGIIAAAVALARQGIPIQATVQANLRRSPADADLLVEANAAVRLVKGAYRESSQIAHAWGEETDLAYVGLAHRLADSHVPVALATHDRVIREALLPILGGATVEMLLGVRSQDAEELVQRGHKVRVYVPYGHDWFRYWMRRRVESLG